MSNEPGNKKNGKPADKSGDKDDKASKEYLKDYLKKVYGVQMSGQHNAITAELAQSGQHLAVKIVADEFLFRLLARFNDLDVAPLDGFISMAEIEYAINNPRLHFDDKDQQMLRIVKRYYLRLKEVAQQEDPERSPHHGISRKDLELLSTSVSKAGQGLRKRLQEEFALKESSP